MRPTTRTAIVTPLWGPFFEETGVPAAGTDGRTVFLTGHTGEDRDGVFSPDPETQIRCLFTNIQDTLVAAGTDWSEVVEMTSYHVGLREQAEVLTRVSHEFLATPAPAWSAVGVAELWDEGAVIEMSCVAVRGGPRTETG
jgi:enamine deaminase RidA (YjgF/YER057c/UK114 family)